MAFSFVHAADLHLDSPFTGLAEDAPPHVAAVLRQATFDAYDALIRLCIDRCADFALIAGDVYDGADRSLRAQLRFLDGLEKLAANGIRSFVVHGNHDPLDGWASTIQWPSGTVVFGGNQVDTVEVAKNGVPVAAVSGISYPTRKETRRLSEAFHAGRPGLFQIALLHCNCGSSAGHEPYAPCTPAELKALGFDYWALGHVHTRAVLNAEPSIVYPGNLQGRSIREQGERGCYCVTVHDSRRVDLEFCPLDVVRWTASSVAIDGYTGPEELDRALAARVGEAREGSDGRPVVCRITLVGRGPLYAELNRADALSGLLERARDEGLSEDPLVWVERLERRCGPAIDLDKLRQRADLLGQLLRTAEELRSAPSLEEALAPALAELHDDARARKALDPLSREELEEALRDAEFLCATLLETER